MDTRENYRQAILKVLQEHLPRTPQADLEVTMVCDHENGHYQIVHSGWRPTGYSFGCVLHIDLRADGKVVVRHNGTESMIGDDLHAAGVAKRDIILAFLPDYAQAAAGFGEARA